MTKASKKYWLLWSKNLRTLKPELFWFVLDNHSWINPYHSEGRRRPLQGFAEDRDRAY